MTLRAGVVQVRGMRLALALVPSEQACAGRGDALIKRLTPWFPTLPIMLVALDAAIPRAYATFDTAALLLELDLENAELRDIDLDQSAPDTRELPF